MHPLLARSRRFIASPVFPVWLILPLTLLYFVFFRQHQVFTDVVYFGADTYVYQSMGVNLATGHGMNIFGQMEPFDRYQFALPQQSEQFGTVPRALYDWQKSLFQNAASHGGEVVTMRMPLYTLFLGGIYSIVGIHPIVVKDIQLLLMAITAAGVPLLGSLWWKQKGLLAGIVAGPIFLFLNEKFATAILVEALTVFTLFLFVLAGILYQKGPSGRTALFVGFAFGLCLLTKLSLLLLFPIFLVLLWWHHREHPAAYRPRFFALMVGVILLMLLPWSFYATVKAGTPVLFSTFSADHIFLNAHNEYVPIDGEWHYEWKQNPQSVYNTDKMQNQSDMARVLHFYLQHPNRIARLPLSKLVAAFTTLPAVVFFILFLLMDGAFGRLLQSPRLRALSLLATIVLWWLCVTHDWLHRTLQLAVNSPGMWMVLPLCVCIGALLIRRSALGIAPRIPLILSAILLNFFITVILVTSDPAIYPSRYVRVADFLFILFALYLLIHRISLLYPRKTKEETQFL